MTTTNSQLKAGEVGDVTLLMREIVALSEADSFSVAKHEWKLDSIEECLEYGDEQCLCGHPILEMCWLRNRHNRNRALVGNVCVTKFLGIRSDLVFSCLKRIRLDSDKAMNAELIAFARQSGWINSTEYGFLSDTERKRNLSVKQMGWRRALNQRVTTFASTKRQL